MNIFHILKKIKKHLFADFYFFKYSFLIKKKRKETYFNHYQIILNKIRNSENIAFTRFSDGELFMMLNKRIQITETEAFLGKKLLGRANFTKEEVKLFDPKQHQFYREKLFESYFFDKKNYYKGISCTCCNGLKYVKYMKSILENNNHNLKYITFSNVLMNGNYKYFIKDYLEIFKKRKIIIILSKYASINKLPFNVIKDFRIGENCMVNNYDLIDDLKKYIKLNNIKDHIFLFSASTLTNFIIHELFKDYDNNTYLDIGSSLNPYFDMQGWKVSRGYLKEFWLEERPQFYLNKKCYW